MSRIVHNKLVRDAVPKAIRRSGGDPVVSTLRNEDRRYHLYLKLLEEAYETFRSGADVGRFVDEAADLLEVLRALASELGIDWDTIEQRRVARQAELGGFSQGIFLECVRTATDNLELADKIPSTLCLLTRSSVPTLLDVLRRELASSRHCRIATSRTKPGCSTPSNKAGWSPSNTMRSMMRPITRASGGRGSATTKRNSNVA